MEELILQSLLETRLSRIENQFTQNLIAGKTAEDSDGNIAIYNDKDVVIQKLSVHGANRVPLFNNNVVEWYNSKPSFSSVAFVKFTEQGQVLYEKELTQFGEM